jgi:thiol-disulfide isomerase/thioredoxin
MLRQRLAAITLAAATTLATAAQAATGPTWSRDVDGSLAAARRAGKLVLVDAYADWCGWCKKLEREVFPTPEFVSFARDYVLLRIDVEDGGRGTEMADTYGAESLPMLLLLEPSGALAGAVSGYAPAPALVARLQAAVAAHERELEDYRRTLASGDAVALDRLAIELWQRRDGARAAAAFEKLLATASLPASEEIWTRFLLADAWRLAGEVDKARAAAAAAQQAVARAHDVDRDLGERVALLPFWIAETARDCGGAAGQLARFEREHPASPLLEEARRALARLQADSGPRCS